MLWFAFWAMQHAHPQQQVAMRSIVSALVFTGILFMVAINMPIMSSIWKSFSGTFVSKKRKAAVIKWVWFNFFVAIALTALFGAPLR